MEKELHREKAWLQKQLQEGLSEHQIAKLAGVSATTVSRWIKRHGLTPPPQKRALHLELTPSLVEFLDGLFVGGGSLVSHFPRTAYFTITSTNKAFILWIAQQLKELGIQQRGKITIMRGPHNINPAWRYQSFSYYELKDVYSRWYPDGRKRLPQDFTLTPTVALLWYFRGGFMYYSKSRKYRLLRFSVGRFSKDDILRLGKMLEDIGCRVSLYLPPKYSPAKIAIFNPGVLFLYIKRNPLPRELATIFPERWKRAGF